MFFFDYLESMQFLIHSSSLIKPVRVSLEFYHLLCIVYVTYQMSCYSIGYQILYSLFLGCQRAFPGVASILGICLAHKITCNQFNQHLQIGVNAFQIFRYYTWGKEFFSVAINQQPSKLPPQKRYW